jgi:hypothetical protein
MSPAILQSQGTIGLVAPGICHPGRVSLHTKHASEMECSRDLSSG